MEEIREMSEEAKANGLAVVIWSYPRGGGIDQGGRNRAWTSAPTPRTWPRCSAPTSSR
jgi:DhnA family fructose-bisphosphate aldolase class Ia